MSLALPRRPSRLDTSASCSRAVLLTCGAVVFALLVYAAVCRFRPTASAAHLEHYVFLSIERDSQAPACAVVFHRNGLGLYRQRDAHEATSSPSPSSLPSGKSLSLSTENSWRPCTYTWQPHTRRLYVASLPVPAPTQPPGPRPNVVPLASATVLFHTQFPETVAMPERGLRGFHAQTRSSDYYLWHTQPHAPLPSWNEKPLRFLWPVSAEGFSYPFHALRWRNARRVECISVDEAEAPTAPHGSSREVVSTITLHRAHYRPSLPTTSRWTCALYIRGQPLSTLSSLSEAHAPKRWKTATVRLDVSNAVADVQWKDLAGKYHVRRGVRIQRD